jgi:hypothetical protein
MNAQPEWWRSRGGALLGIAGFKRSGKNTFADALAVNGWHLDAFANPLRRFTADVIGTSIDGLDLIKELPHPVLENQTPRYLMQILGTEWMRDTFGQEVWIRALDRRIQSRLRSGINVAVFDVRFPNEARYILEQGGSVVWIDRPGLEAGDHRSEAGLPAELITHRITNDQDVHHLQRIAALFATMS